MIEGMFNNLFKNFADLTLKIDGAIEKKIGFSPAEKLVEMDEADEELRKTEPLKWTVKKLTISTLKGIFGSTLSK